MSGFQPKPWSIWKHIWTKDDNQSANNTNRIQVNKFTNDPDKAWELEKNNVAKIALETLSLDTPIYKNKVINLWMGGHEQIKSKLILNR